jgi:hypothetical protein
MADVSNTFYEGQAFIGYGSQLLVGDGASPESFEAVADIESITFGEMSTAVVTKTHLRSPEGHQEKLAALRDSGPFQLTGNWRPTHQSQSNVGGGSTAFASGGLIALWRNRTERNMKIILSDGTPGTELPFRGVVTKFQPGVIGVNEKVNFTAEITPLRDFSAFLP